MKILPLNVRVVSNTASPYRKPLSRTEIFASLSGIISPFRYTTLSLDILIPPMMFRFIHKR